MKNWCFLILAFSLCLSCGNEEESYICPPCNLSCDDLTFSRAGTCPHCGMELIEKSTLIVNAIKIQPGSGYFAVEGGKTKQDKTVTVFYHRPENFSTNSKILFVIPGAGRSGESYRDAWIEESEKYGVLILSLMYPEREYAFEDYHLGGLIEHSNLDSCITYLEDTNIAALDEERLVFELNSDPEAWLFNDFDRIFDAVVSHLNSTQTTYDIFGHSAGGHILHRFTIFQKRTKADKIFVANPSFYTLPSFDYIFPFGLNGSLLAQEELESAFVKKMILFLGELDNKSETAGTFLRSKSADAQGLHRLARGRLFFEEARQLAAQKGYAFNWQIQVVPGVGHDHRLMGDAVAQYLYENE